MMSAHSLKQQKVQKRGKKTREESRATKKLQHVLMVAGGENTRQKWSRFEHSEVAREGDAGGVREKREQA